MSSQNPNMNTNATQPGLIAGHAEYLKGATQSTIGSITGSHAWTSSGEQAKAHGLSVMQSVGAKRDAQAQGYGKVEEMAGKALGCDGMRREGEASVKERSQ